MRIILQSFSLGILFSTILLSVLYLNEGKNNIQQVGKMTQSEMKAELEEHGFFVLTSEQYEQIQWPESSNNEKDVNEISSSNKENTTTQESVIYLLQIENGMNSEFISKLLEEEDIIQNSKELDKYLQKTGLSTKIQIGSYELSSKMTFEEIARTITKNME
ncbi:hypothetical protein RZN22_01045 [Bacillaceae bacterium S4-13-58]